MLALAETLCARPLAVTFEIAPVPYVATLTAPMVTPAPRGTPLPTSRRRALFPATSVLSPIVKPRGFCAACVLAYAGALSVLLGAGVIAIPLWPGAAPLLVVPLPATSVLPNIPSVVPTAVPCTLTLPCIRWRLAVSFLLRSSPCVMRMLARTAPCRCRAPCLSVATLRSAPARLRWWMMVARVRSSPLWTASSLASSFPLLTRLPCVMACR